MFLVLPFYCFVFLFVFFTEWMSQKKVVFILLFGCNGFFRTEKMFRSLKTTLD